MLSTSDKLKAMLLSYSDADTKRMFNFSSGHLGALPLTDLNIRQFFECKRLPSSLSVELLYFLMGTLFPLKWCSILIRAFSRSFQSVNVPNKSTLLVLSLGESNFQNDEYFGPLLKSMGSDNFHYLKIISGLKIKNSNASFIEIGLNRGELVLMMIFAPFFRIALLAYTCRSLTSLISRSSKELFALICLREINSGATLNQYLVGKAVLRYAKKNKIQTLLFPLEGRNWEKILSHGMHKLNKRSIGYLHCALTPRHLSLLSNQFMTLYERPDVLIAPGQMPYNLLTKVHPNINVRKGFFLRAQGSKNTELMLSSSKYLLFALTGNVDESKIIIQSLAEFSIHSPMPILIRLNRNTSSFEYLASVTRQYGLNIQDRDDVSPPYICFYRSSSVALDYLRRNIPIVYIAIQEPLSSNIFELTSGQFDEIRLESNFGIQLLAYIQKYSTDTITNGDKKANAYLDQEYNSHQLISLLD